MKHITTNKQTGGNLMNTKKENHKPCTWYKLPLDLAPAIMSLSDEEAGELLKNFYCFLLDVDGEEPDFNSRTAHAIFSVMKFSVLRQNEDIQRYSKAGLKKWE